MPNPFDEAIKALDLTPDDYAGYGDDTKALLQGNYPNSADSGTISPYRYVDKATGKTGNDILAELYQKKGKAYQQPDEATMDMPYQKAAPQLTAEQAVRLPYEEFAKWKAENPDAWKAYTSKPKPIIDSDNPADDSRKGVPLSFPTEEEYLKNRKEEKGVDYNEELEKERYRQNKINLQVRFNEASTIVQSGNLVSESRKGSDNRFLNNYSRELAKQNVVIDPKDGLKYVINLDGTKSLMDIPNRVLTSSVGYGFAPTTNEQLYETHMDKKRANWNQDFTRIGVQGNFGDKSNNEVAEKRGVYLKKKLVPGRVVQDKDGKGTHYQQEHYEYEYQPLEDFQQLDAMGQPFRINEEGNKEMLVLDIDPNTGEPVYITANTDAVIGSQKMRSIYNVEKKYEKTPQIWDSFWNGLISTPASLGSLTATLGEFAGWKDWVDAGNEWSNYYSAKQYKIGQNNQGVEWSLGSIARTGANVLGQVLPTMALGAVARLGTMGVQAALNSGKAMTAGQMLLASRMATAASTSAGALQAAHAFDDNAKSMGIPAEDRKWLYIAAAGSVWASSYAISRAGGLLDDLIGSYKNKQQGAVLTESIKKVLSQYAAPLAAAKTAAEKKSIATTIVNGAFGLMKKGFKAMGAAQGSQSRLVRAIGAGVEEGLEEGTEEMINNLTKASYDKFMASDEAKVGRGKFGTNFEDVLEGVGDSLSGGAFGGFLLGGIFSRAPQRPAMNAYVTAQIVGNANTWNEVEEQVNESWANLEMGNAFVREDNSLILPKDQDTAISKNDAAKAAFLKDLKAMWAIKQQLGLQGEGAVSILDKVFGNDEKLLHKTMAAIKVNDMAKAKLATLQEEIATAEKNGSDTSKLREQAENLHRDIYGDAYAEKVKELKDKKGGEKELEQFEKDNTDKLAYNEKNKDKATTGNESDLSHILSGKAFNDYLALQSLRVQDFAAESMLNNLMAQAKPEEPKKEVAVDRSKEADEKLKERIRVARQQARSLQDSIDQRIAQASQISGTQAPGNREQLNKKADQATSLLFGTAEEQEADNARNKEQEANAPKWYEKLFKKKEAKPATDPAAATEPVAPTKPLEKKEVKEMIRAIRAAQVKGDTKLFNELIEALANSATTEGDAYKDNDEFFPYTTNKNFLTPINEVLSEYKSAAPIGEISQYLNKQESGKIQSANEIVRAIQAKIAKKIAEKEKANELAIEAGEMKKEDAPEYENLNALSLDNDSDLYTLKELNDKGEPTGAFFIINGAVLNAAKNGGATIKDMPGKLFVSPNGTVESSELGTGEQRVTNKKRYQMAQMTGAGLSLAQMVNDKKESLSAYAQLLQGQVIDSGSVPAGAIDDYKRQLKEVNELRQAMQDMIAIQRVLKAQAKKDSDFEIVEELANENNKGGLEVLNSIMDSIINNILPVIYATIQGSQTARQEQQDKLNAFLRVHYLNAVEGIATALSEIKDDKLKEAVAQLKIDIEASTEVNQIWVALQKVQHLFKGNKEVANALVQFAEENIKSTSNYGLSKSIDDLNPKRSKYTDWGGIILGQSINALLYSDIKDAHEQYLEAVKGDKYKHTIEQQQMVIAGIIHYDTVRAGGKPAYNENLDAEILSQNTITMNGSAGSGKSSYVLKSLLSVIKSRNEKKEQKDKEMIVLIAPYESQVLPMIKLATELGLVEGKDFKVYTQEGGNRKSYAEYIAETKTDAGKLEKQVIITDEYTLLDGLLQIHLKNKVHFRLGDPFQVNENAIDVMENGERAVSPLSNTPYTNLAFPLTQVMRSNISEIFSLQSAYRAVAGGGTQAYINLRAFDFNYALGGENSPNEGIRIAQDNESVTAAFESRMIELVGSPNIEKEIMLALFDTAAYESYVSSESFEKTAKAMEAAGLGIEEAKSRLRNCVRVSYRGNSNSQVRPLQGSTVAELYLAYSKSTSLPNTKDNVYAPFELTAATRATHFVMLAQTDRNTEVAKSKQVKPGEIRKESFDEEKEVANKAAYNKGLTATIAAMTGQQAAIEVPPTDKNTTQTPPPPTGQDLPPTGEPKADAPPTQSENESDLDPDAQNQTDNVQEKVADQTQQNAQQTVNAEEENVQSETQTPPPPKAEPIHTTKEDEEILDKEAIEERDGNDEAERETEPKAFENVSSFFIQMSNLPFQTGKTQEQVRRIMLTNLAFLKKDNGQYERDLYFHVVEGLKQYKGDTDEAVLTGTVAADNGKGVVVVTTSPTAPQVENGELANLDELVGILNPSETVETTAGNYAREIRYRILNGIESSEDNVKLEGKVLKLQLTQNQFNPQFVFFKKKEGADKGNVDLDELHKEENADPINEKEAANLLSADIEEQTFNSYIDQLRKIWGSENVSILGATKTSYTVYNKSKGAGEWRPYVEVEIQIIKVVNGKKKIFPLYLQIPVAIRKYDTPATVEKEVANIKRIAEQERKNLEIDAANAGLVYESNGKIYGRTGWLGDWINQNKTEVMKAAEAAGITFNEQLISEEFGVKVKAGTGKLEAMEAALNSKTDYQKIKDLMEKQNDFLNKIKPFLKVAYPVYRKAGGSYVVPTNSLVAPTMNKDTVIQPGSIPVNLGVRKEEETQVADPFASFYDRAFATDTEYANANEGADWVSDIEAIAELERQVGEVEWFIKDGKTKDGLRIFGTTILPNGKPASVLFYRDANEQINFKTVVHEAMHVITERKLNPEFRAKLMDEVYTKTGLQGTAAIEWLADRYEQYATERRAVKGIGKLIKQLFDFFGYWFRQIFPVYRNLVKDVFYRANTGQYRTTPQYSYDKVDAAYNRSGILEKAFGEQNTNQIGAAIAEVGKVMSKQLLSVVLSKTTVMNSANLYNGLNLKELYNVLDVNSRNPLQDLLRAVGKDSVLKSKTNEELEALGKDERKTMREAIQEEVGNLTVVVGSKTVAVKELKNYLSGYSNQAITNINGKNYPNKITVGELYRNYAMMNDYNLEAAMQAFLPYVSIADLHKKSVEDMIAANAVSTDTTQDKNSEEVNIMDKQSAFIKLILSTVHVNAKGVNVYELSEMTDLVTAKVIEITNRIYNGISPENEATEYSDFLSRAFGQTLSAEEKAKYKAQIQAAANGDRQSQVAVALRKAMIEIADGYKKNSEYSKDENGNLEFLSNPDYIMYSQLYNRLYSIATGSLSHANMLRLYQLQMAGESIAQSEAQAIIDQYEKTNPSGRVVTADELLSHIKSVSKLSLEIVDATTSYFTSISKDNYLKMDGTSGNISEIMRADQQQIADKLQDDVSRYFVKLDGTAGTGNSRMFFGGDATMSGAKKSFKSENGEPEFAVTASGESEVKVSYKGNTFATLRKDAKSWTMEISKMSSGQTQASFVKEAFQQMGREKFSQVLVNILAGDREVKGWNYNTFADMYARHLLATYLGTFELLIGNSIQGETDTFQFKNVDKATAAITTETRQIPKDILTIKSAFKDIAANPSKDYGTSTGTEPKSKLLNRTITADNESEEESADSDEIFSPLSMYKDFYALADLIAYTDGGMRNSFAHNPKGSKVYLLRNDDTITNTYPGGTSQQLPTMITSEIEAAQLAQRVRGANMSQLPITNTNVFVAKRGDAIESITALNPLADGTMNEMNGKKSPMFSGLFYIPGVFNKANNKGRTLKDLNLADNWDLQGQLIQSQENPAKFRKGAFVQMHAQGHRSAQVVFQVKFRSEVVEQNGLLHNGIYTLNTAAKTADNDKLGMDTMGLLFATARRVAMLEQAQMDSFTRWRYALSKVPNKVNATEFNAAYTAYESLFNKRFDLESVKDYTSLNNARANLYKALTKLTDTNAEIQNPLFLTSYGLQAGRDYLKVSIDVLGKVMETDKNGVVQEVEKVVKKAVGIAPGLSTNINGNHTIKVDNTRVVIKSPSSVFQLQ